MQLTPLTAELQRLQSLISARTGLRETKADYGPLAISLLGASIFSPLCLLSGAQHAYNAYNRQTQMDEINLSTLQATLATILNSWNGLLAEKIPLLSYHVIDDLFPIRLKLAKFVAAVEDNIQGQDAERLKRVVSRKSARLETFGHYPEDPSMNYSRGEIIQRIKDARDSMEYSFFFNPS